MKDDKPIRVAHVTFGFDVGGLENLLLEFARYSDRDRYQLTFASLGHIGPIGEELRCLGYPVVCMHRPEGLHPSLVGQLHRFFRRIDADVVHTHGLGPLIHAAPAARMAGVRSIIHTQHDRSFGETRRQQWLIRQAAKMTRRFVCVSEDIGERAAENGICAKKVRVLHSGIAGNTFRSGSADNPTRNNVACVTRLCHDKGVSTLIDAAAILVERDPSIEVLIAGDGICRNELQQQIEQHSLQENVKLLGLIDRVDELLHHTRVFVLPSNSEGLPLTLLEAMFASVPIVATDVGGTLEAIDHNRNGLLVPPSDPSAMADAIFDLWNDADLCDRLSEEGLRVAEARFGIDQTLRGYQRFYEANLRFYEASHRITD